jgi:trigger factor
MAMETAQTNPLERVLTLTLSLSEVQNEVGSRLKKLSRTVRMQGFRPGKVPMNLVTQQYGGQVHQEVLGDLANTQFGNAVREQNLHVAGMPRFEANDQPATEGQFQFTATFEVYPEVSPGDVSQAAINRPVTEVTDEDVDRTLDVLRRQRVRYEPADRGAAEGDQVVIDFAGYLDDKPFEGGSAKGHRLVLGQGQFLADFEANLTGMKAGESKSFNLTFPADYHAEELAGKTVRFDVTVHEVNQGILPEINEDFARAVGVPDGDLQKMREELKRNLEREVRNRIKAQVKEQAMQALLEATTLDLPRALVQQEIARLRQDALAQLQGRAQNTAEVTLPDELFEDQARRRVSLGLILSELVRRENLSATPEKVRAVIDDMAGAYENPDEIVRWYYQQPQHLREVEALVLEDNVVEWVCVRAKTQEVVTPFQLLVGNP